MSVSLTKGANISLVKEAPELSSVVLELGWGKKQTRGFFGISKQVDVDLDASCLIFDEKKKLLAQVWHQQFQNRDGSVIHTGDDMTGGGQADTPNEKIIVKLNLLSNRVKTLVFTVNSFSYESFDGIPNAFCVLKDESSGKEIASYNLSVEGSGHTGLVIAKIYRHKGDWKFKALGEWGEGKTFNDLLPIIDTCL